MEEKNKKNEGGIFDWRTVTIRISHQIFLTAQPVIPMPLGPIP